MPSQPRNSQPPARHVALIADGNRRWARARGLPVSAGYEAGADTLKARLADAIELGVEELSIYSFSTENWSRPAAEIHELISTLAARIEQETPELHADGVRMRFMGRRDAGSAELSALMDWAESLTEANRRITLCIAFNYGGRAEILDAARRFAAKRVAQSAEGREAGPLARQSDEAEFRACLYAPEMHDPDLIIRTSGERRLSNYLLWQSAYSELIFREELWPDFTREALEQSLAEYAERRRRFGGR